MKIQCQCGTKYAFDVTPEMAANPITLICQNCGADNSRAVNMLIRQQFPTTATESVPAPVAEVAPPPPPESRPRMKVAVPVAAPAAETSTASAAPQMCRKHPGHFTSEQCRVCQKSICPQCMVVFGYVCSAFCKNEAETHGIELPVYAQQAGVAARRETRKLGKIILGLGGGVALLLGGYIWFLSAGSKPRVVFAASFPAVAHTGAVKLYERDAVVLHGGRLARFDWKSKKEIWGVELLNHADIELRATQALKEHEEDLAAWAKNRTGLETVAPTRHTKEDFLRRLTAAAQGEFTLHVHEQQIWLRTDTEVTPYDWATGQRGKPVVLAGGIERAQSAPEALLLFTDSKDGEDLVRLDWKTGEMRTQPLARRPALAAALTNLLSRTNLLAAAARARGPTNALRAFRAVQQDPLQVRLAAPAIAANAVQNRRLEMAMEDDEDDGEEGPLARFSDLSETGDPRFIIDGPRVVEFSTRMLEHKTIERQAMKAAPTKSALEGNVNQAATVAIANEIFNEFQRERTGGIEFENVSRYEVTIKRDGDETKHEVIGPPKLFPLSTVDLLVAGKTLHVLDKAGKKLWESKLSFEIGGGFGLSPWDNGLLANADAPGVERDGLLYFFDAGVLACFELANGNARWRQPSVGITKLLFDDKGMLYVDTTTGSADRLKYSQQVDISDKAYPVIIKIDPKTGKALWRSEHNGRLSRVEGKFIYTLEWGGGDEDDEPTGLLGGMRVPPHIRLRRLSASDGKVKWEHYQKRSPLGLDIQGNTIQIVFKKEMQVLKFIGL